MRRNGEAAGLRRAVGADRAVDPDGEAALSLPRSSAARRPQGADRDLVRVADGDDLLATLTRVAGGGGLAATARAGAGEAARGRPDRLVAGSDRQFARAGVW